MLSGMNVVKYVIHEVSGNTLEWQHVCTAVRAPEMNKVFQEVTLDLDCWMRLDH